jgi:hypothetical protein
VKAHKIEVYVVDFEGYGSDEYVNVIEGNRYLRGARVGTVQTIDIGEWDDDHPLNLCSTDPGEYFSKALTSKPE